MRNPHRLRAGAIVLFVLSALLLPRNGVAADLRDIVPQIKYAVVGIAGYDMAAYPEMRIYATGFAVLDGRHIVTVSHAVRDPAGGVRPGLSVAIPGAGGAIYRPAQIAAEDREHDLALLRISGDSLAVLSFSNMTVAEGDEIAFTGFPSGGKYGFYPVTHKGIISSIAERGVAGTAMLARGLSGDYSTEHFEIYQIDAIALTGSSGSPVYDLQTGAVLAVIASGVVKDFAPGNTQPVGLTYAIPARFISALIENRESRFSSSK